MIQEIKYSIEYAVHELIQRAWDTNQLSSLLLIARGNMDSTGTTYVVDDIWDVFRWKTQERFYIRYLNKNYYTDGFLYQGEEGLDDLNIEMMIYSHIWASNDFLKTLYRLGEIFRGESYSWNIDVDDFAFGKKKWMQNNVIDPIEANSLQISEFLKEAYCTPIRNAFAHALYDINVENQKITIYPQSGYYTLDFSEFQRKFLYSAFLINSLHNELMILHDQYAQMNCCLTKPFIISEGVKCQLFGQLTQRGDEIFPEFRIKKVF